MRSKKHQIYYHAMLLPGIILILIFNITPMFGLVMAFQRFEPVKGIFRSAFVGMQNFRLVMLFPDSRQVFFNTLIIAISKIVLGIIVPVTFAIILNECRILLFKRAVQTIVYLPNFMSWVILGVIISNVFNGSGILNTTLMALGPSSTPTTTGLEVICLTSPG